MTVTSEHPRRLLEECFRSRLVYGAPKKEVEMHRLDRHSEKCRVSSQTNCSRLVISLLEGVLSILGRLALGDSGVSNFSQSYAFILTSPSSLPRFGIFGRLEYGDDSMMTSIDDLSVLTDMVPR